MHASQKELIDALIAKDPHRMIETLDEIAHELVGRNFESMGNVFPGLNNDFQKFVESFYRDGYAHVLVYLPDGGLSRIYIEAETQEPKGRRFEVLGTPSLKMKLTSNSMDKARMNWKQKNFSEEWLPLVPQI